MEHNELYQRLGLPQQVVEALSEYGKTRSGSYLVKIEDLIADIGVMKGLEGKTRMALECFGRSLILRGKFLTNTRSAGFVPIFLMIP